MTDEWDGQEGVCGVTRPSVTVLVTVLRGDNDWSRFVYARLRGGGERARESERERKRKRVGCVGHARTITYAHAD